MPHMNRIRVNNVKYNFGQQMYDDFVLRLHGKNTIYDLANGGGKSVLMLLLLQNLIPNCTLDEKQPIEKLFRTSGGSTTIHSLVEWNLDEADIEDDYRFMLTGFCARKAKDSSEEEGVESNRDTAAIDYFNYCIFYRAYNENDLVNLPLVKDGERVTYNGLKNYLKDLDREVASLKVYIFERKGEYQQFISKYGLYESAWEIVRGINKTEGHVRTYFETNYKTTRKVVEDLLIEEIIEKSFRDKTDKADIEESMAKTLLDIKDKLMELSEKKNEMNRFEHQKELLHVLSNRVQALKELYKDKDYISSELLSAHLMLKHRVEDEEDELLRQKRAIEAKDQECRQTDRVVACLKVQKEEDVLHHLQKAQQDAQEKVASTLEQWNRQKEKYQAKENANEYIEYKRLAKQCATEQGVIDKAKDGAGSNLDRLYDLAAIKKSYLDQRLDGVRTRLEDGLTLERNLKIELKAMMKTKRELECEHAVAAADKDRLSIVAKTKEELVNDARKELNVLLLEDLPELMRAKRKECHEKEQSVEQLKRQLESLQDQKTVLTMQQQECMAYKNVEEKQNDSTRILKEKLEQNEPRIKALLTTYEAEERNFAELKDKIEERVEDALKTRAHLQEELAKKQQFLRAKQDGKLIANTALLEELVSYLRDRHGFDAMLGQDYVLALTPEERRAILLRVPFLPYGVVVEHSDEESLKSLLFDARLREICNEQMIPLFIKETLQEMEVNDSFGYFFLYGQEQSLLLETGLEEVAKQAQQECNRCEQEYASLTELCQVMEDDKQFLLEQMQLQSLMTMLSGDDKTVTEEPKDWDEKLNDIGKQLAALVEQKQTLLEGLDAATTEHEQTVQELEQFNRVEKLAKEQQQVKLEAATAAQKEEELLQRMQEADSTIESKNHMLKDTREKNRSYQEKIEEGEALWQDLYVDYYKQDRRVLDLGYTEDQVDAEFGSLRTVVEKGLGNVQDKQTLVDTLLRNIERLEQNLRRRGADLEQLKEQYDAGELAVCSEADLTLLKKDSTRYEQGVEQAKTELNEVQKSASKAEGRIEHGLRQLEEQGIQYTRLNNLEEMDVERALQEQQQVLMELVKTKEEMTAAFISLQKEHARRLDFYKDVRRIKEMYHLKVEDGMELPDLSDYSFDRLKKCQKEFEQIIGKEQKARQDLEQYKQQTAQTLSELEAYELAEVIRRDVVLPETLGQMNELTDSLADMIGFIDLEQERVEQGIQDMQLIKSNFESQCIRRCQDVRTELTRLPNLSSITLDGETIQMIDLKIPYVSDEMVASKMSDYIDHIVKGVDRFDTFAERMKFIRSQLALKRMFSVIVTDMNAIRLQLYKRERIKEQSRYLRYEEAVGSTGQSQGIYIQFLIAVINYIANIHSVNSDNNNLGKVIFIDNPFGAAKDIYIWEPIFEMLKTNNVQLIVPARGATPAITGRFDVNYILGQKLVGGKQQTVVVDYRSQVEKTEVEYKKLEFTQTSFDFI